MKNPVTYQTLLGEYRAINKDPARSFRFPEIIPLAVEQDTDCGLLLARAVNFAQDEFCFSEVAAMARAIERGAPESLGYRKELAARRKILHIALGSASLLARTVPIAVKRTNRFMGRVKDGMDVGGQDVPSDSRRLRLYANSTGDGMWQTLRPTSLPQFAVRREERESDAAGLADGYGYKFDAYHSRRRAVRHLAALYTIAAMGAERLDEPVVETALGLQKANNLIGQSLGAQAGQEILRAPGEARELLGQYLDGIPFLMPEPVLLKR